MGFIGKPSKACEPCRSRRTRCDQQKPQCGQCLRKSVSCTFRDPVDLAFRNENETVARKAQWNQTDGEGDTFSDTTVVENSSGALELTSLGRVLNETTEDVATMFFLSNWSQGIYKDYIPALCLRTDCSAALRSTVEAMGFAALSIARSDVGLMTAARNSHVFALRQVQMALSSWTTARRDDTLAAIMLLALFAGITCEPDVARANWSKHIRGALAVLNVRLGQEDDSDLVFSNLSNHVTACVLIDCIQSAVSPPKQLQSLKFEQPVPSSFQQKSECILDLLVSLRQTPISELTTTEILESFDRIDEELDDVAKMLNTYYPISIEKQELGIHEPPLHTYPGPNPVCSSRLWNFFRMAKLSAFELRYEKMLERQEYEKVMGDDFELDYQQQLIYASNSSAEVILDLCASIPACLRSNEATDQHHIMNWCAALLWPLSTAQASPHIPTSLRPFARRQLQNLWEISQLSAVDCHQEDIEDGIAPHMWTHVFFIC